jgi:hypothetical protein
MASLGELDDIGCIIISYVEKRIAFGERGQEDGRGPPELERGVDADMDRLGITNLRVIVVDEVVHGVPDGFTMLSSSRDALSPSWKLMIVHFNLLVRGTVVPQLFAASARMMLFQAARLALSFVW